MPSAPALRFVPPPAPPAPPRADDAPARASVPADLPAEPFGQTGVRQFFPRLLAWVGLTLGLATLALGYRSGNVTDIAEWTGRDQRAAFVSANGQFVFGSSDYATKTFSNLGWNYDRGRVPRWLNQRLFGSTAWGFLGFEAHGGPLQADADRGFWVRGRWSTVAAAFMIQPVAWALVRAAKRVSRRKAVE